MTVIILKIPIVLRNGSPQEKGKQKLQIKKNIVLNKLQRNSSNKIRDAA